MNSLSHEATAVPAPPCVAEIATSGSERGLTPNAPRAEETGGDDFGSFYRATLLPLRNYLRGILGSLHDAEDIAHDAFVRTQQAMERQVVGKPRSFLFTTARHLAIDYGTRRRRRMEPTEVSVLEAKAGLDSDPADAVMARQDDEGLEAAIVGLPPACQRVLVLRLKHGLSHAEIGERLGISPSTACNQLIKAVRLLRETMRPDAAKKPREISPPSP